VKLEMLVERVLSGEAGVAVFTDVRPSLGVTCQVHLATHTGQPSLKLGVSVLWFYAAFSLEIRGSHDAKHAAEIWHRIA